MEPTSISRAESLRAYPTLSATARMIGVSPSTLTRRDDVETVERGSRDLVVAPAEVLRLASVYRKRSLNEVAADLIDAAELVSPADATWVEEAVEAFFAGRTTHEPKRDFLDQAKQYLPKDLYAEVERTVLKGEGRKPAPIVGHIPPTVSAANKPKPKAEKRSPAARVRKTKSRTQSTSTNPHRRTSAER
jgi:hypothetical protein